MSGLSRGANVRVVQGKLMSTKLISSGFLYPLGKYNIWTMESYNTLMYTEIHLKTYISTSFFKFFIVGVASKNYLIYDLRSLRNRPLARAKGQPYYGDRKEKLKPKSGPIFRF